MKQKIYVKNEDGSYSLIGEKKVYDVRSFFGEITEFSSSELVELIEKIWGRSHSSAHKIMGQKVAEGVLEKRRMGNKMLYRLAGTEVQNGEFLDRKQKEKLEKECDIVKKVLGDTECYSGLFIERCAADMKKTCQSVRNKVKRMDINKRKDGLRVLYSLPAG